MPTTTGLATSFITFSRPGASGGGATVTDRDGKIKWAGHNLLTNSESFDNAAWNTASGVTITANNAVAPNGTTTADLYTATNTVNYRGQTGVTVVAAQHTQSCFVKRGNTDWVYMNVSQTGGDRGAWFNVATGAKGTEESGVTASIQSVGSGWYLCSITLALTAGNVVAVLPRPRSGDNSTTTSALDTVLLWGAHLYRSDMQMQLNPAMPAGMQSYYPTTPRNLLGYTEDFSSWTKDGTTVNTNAVIAPNGLQTADAVLETATTGEHSVYQSITASSGQQTLSFYAKAGLRLRCHIRLNLSGAWRNANFLLSGSGSVGTTTGFVRATITALVDGWYRCEASFSNRTSALVVIGVSTADEVISYAGDSSAPAVYLWGAQLSDSASLDTYVPQYGAAVTSAAYYAPRLDFDGATLSPKGLLVEELRTNIVLHSNEFDNAAWTKTLLNTTGTPAWVNAAVSPDGTQNADFLIPTTDNNYHSARQTVTVANTTYTFSCCVKANGYNFVVLQLADSNAFGKFYEGVFNLSNGTVENTGRAVTYTGARNTPVSLGNGWYRVSITVNSIDANSTTIVQLLPYNTNDPTSAFAGNGTSGVLVYGAQLEVGASNAAAPFMTSLIPTGSATATRAADVASVSTQAFPYSASEGTLVANVTAFSPSTYAVTSFGAVLFDGVQTYANAIRIEKDGSLWRGIKTQGGSAQIASVSYTQNTATKIGVAYANSNNAASFNGASATSLSGDVPSAANMIGLGGNGINGNIQLNGWVRQITYIPRRLSNAELQSRTA